MSRIGKKPVSVPKGIKVEVNGNLIKVSGPKGSLELNCHPDIGVAFDSGGNQILLTNTHDDSRLHKALHGTMRSLVNNMVEGVSKGYEQKILIYGTGYNVKQQGTSLIFQVGYCHPVELTIPKVVQVKIDVAATRGNDVPAQFTITSPDKRELGQFASDIRRVRPPEPYKGKGIRFADEHITRKVGKAFASGGA